MNILIPFLGGISAKLYDDLDDNNFLTNDMFRECLKGSQWIILTLMSYNDFNYTFFNYLINLLNSFGGHFEQPYETSLLILYPFFLILSFSTRFIPSILDVLYSLCFVSIMAIEPFVITEEYSHRKFAMRVVSLLIMYVGVFVGYHLGVSWNFLKQGIYGVGYALVSCIFQLYMLSQDNDRLLQTLVLRT